MSIEIKSDILAKELNQGIVPLGVPKAYQYDAALVEAARAAVNQGIDDVAEAGATAKAAIETQETASVNAVSAQEQASKADVNALGDKILAQMKHGYGYPFTAASAAAMTDMTKIYVYTGSETGYTNGNWYYWNGTAWTSGGVYNATALETDKTLTVSGAAADAKKTGEQASIEGLSDSYIKNLYSQSMDAFQYAIVSTDGNDATINIYGQYQGAKTKAFVPLSNNIRITAYISFTCTDIQIDLIGVDSNDNESQIKTLVENETTSPYKVDFIVNLSKYSYTSYKVKFWQTHNSTTGVINIMNLVISDYADVRDNAIYSSSLIKLIGNVFNAIDNNIQKLTLMNKYGYIYDQEENINGTWSNVDAGGMIVQSDNDVNVTAPARWQGGKSNSIVTNSAKVNIKLQVSPGNINTTCINIELWYVDSNGVEHVGESIYHVTSGFINHDIDFTFDAASYEQYNDAKSFFITVRNTDVDAVSMLYYLKNITITERKGYKANDMFADKFENLLSNIFTQIDDNTGAIAEIKTVPSNVIIDANGRKYSIQVSTNGSLTTVPHIPNSVLFMGNSLLLGLDTDGSKGGAFGLCASSYNHDYCYLVEQAILEKNSNATFTKLHDALFEQAINTSGGDSYISQNYSAWTDKDLIIVQIGDNVNTNSRREAFQTNINNLLQSIRTNSPNARVLIVGVWFNNSTVHSTLVNAALNYGCEFIDISPFYNNPSNFPIEGSTITYRDTSTYTVQPEWVTHPGDNGMQAIANKIITALDM